MFQLKLKFQLTVYFILYEFLKCVSLLCIKHIVLKFSLNTYCTPLPWLFQNSIRQEH